ncbi:MAG: hypothetical protein JSS75_00435 [Bacteroidetes bacterium]|nr:hypothetical protein [Bacteroidota bacterium]
MKNTVSLLVALFAAIVAAPAYAQIPRQISYQGVIADHQGHPIADGQHVIKTSFYDAPTGGTVLFTQSQPVNITSGVFNIIIGASGAIPNSLDFSNQYWLGISIDSAEEMSPRTPLVSTPYALHAQTADRASSVSADAQGVVTSINEVDGPIRIVGDSTISIVQNGRGITISANPQGVHQLVSPQHTVSIITPRGPITSLDVADSSITAQKFTSMDAAYGQVLTWNGSKWAPANPISGGSNGGWLTIGNSGTQSGLDFLGTLDSQALDLRTYNTISLRLNPNGSLQRDGNGNARGKRAIDLQTARSNTLQVASGDDAVIGGGEYNTASGSTSTVGGGITNAATSSYTTVSGGANNVASDLFAVVSGGGHNSASSTYSTVGGGQSNLASGNGSVIAGGISDTATSYTATIGGGTSNYVKGVGGTIAGGTSSTIGTGYYATIGGGYGNSLSGGDGSTIGGGINGKIVGSISTIGGGYNDVISGDGSVIPGGSYMRLVGSNSFGFNGGRFSADSAVVSASQTAYFGNVDLWIGSTDSTTHALRLYEGQNGGYTYPGANTNYTAFKAGSQSTNITYTLPTAAPSANGALLTSTTGGQWSWTSGANWDGTNSRLGIGTTSPGTSVDVNGDLATREHQVTLVNGNNNNLAIGAYTFIQVSGPTAPFSITGISGGTNGKIVILYNSSGQAMTITSNDVNSAAGNRIFTGNALAYMTPNGYQFDAVTLIYSSSKNGWLLVSHN